MEDPKRPPLTPEILEETALEQHNVHKRYWSLLKAMLGPTGIQLLIVKDASPLPKQPIRLFKTLGEYARALFDAESKSYPKAPSPSQLSAWLLDLAGRTETMVLANLEEMAKGSPFEFGTARGSLTYHATWNEMRAAIRASLKEHSEKFKPKPDPMRFTPPPEPITPVSGRHVWRPIEKDEKAADVDQTARILAGHTAINEPPKVIREEPSPTPLRSRSLTNTSVSQETTKRETVGEQIDRLRRECDDMTVEELAEKVKLDPTNVSRHIRNKSKPTPKNRREYQRVFSNLLNRKVVINETQEDAVKRS